MLTGNKDIDLLIASKLKDFEIEKLDKCVNLKDDKCFWKNRLMNKYKIKVECPVKNWKEFYFEYSKFMDFFHLTLAVNLLKDYYFNKFSINYLFYIRKMSSEDFYPLLTSVLNFLKNCESNIHEEFHRFLNENKDYFNYVQEMYDLTYHKFFWNITINDKFWRKDFLYSYFSQIIYNQIILRKGLLPYTIEINSKGMEINFSIH